MTPMRVARPHRWGEAMAHLGSLDDRWAARIERIGPCGLAPRHDRFATLVRAIVGQLISSAAARTIYARLLERAGDPIRPEGLLALGVEGIRAAGMSNAKSRTIYDLAAAVQSRAIPLDRIGRLDDERLIACLTQVRGIGRWTAEMFLVFALNRPDVLAVADLGIRVGVRDHYGLPALPRPSECVALTEAWRPYRSVAMWYLWREIDASRAAKASGDAGGNGR
jgi:DNA-3-methyladenine glycosylase II